MPMQQMLIDQIVQRVGVSPEKAQVAVEVVLGFLKQRLPGPASALLDKAVAAEAGAPAQPVRLGGLSIEN